jgi:hypothetical protein
MVSWREHIRGQETSMRWKGQACSFYDNPLTRTKASHENHSNSLQAQASDLHWSHLLYHHTEDPVSSTCALEGHHIHTRAWCACVCMYTRRSVCSLWYMYAIYTHVCICICNVHMHIAATCIWVCVHIQYIYTGAHMCVYICAGS